MPDINDVKKKLNVIVGELISHDSEEEWFEFKENWYEPVELGQYISAMSNAAVMRGEDFAYFVWGVKDDDHSIVGTSFKFQVDVKGEPLQHFLARQLTPDVGFSFEEITFENKRVVVLIIPAADGKIKFFLRHSL